MEPSSSTSNRLSESYSPLPFDPLMLQEQSSFQPVVSASYNWCGKGADTETSQSVSEATLCQERGDRQQQHSSQHDDTTPADTVAVAVSSCNSIRGQNSFPHVVYHMLTEMERKEKSEIVSWQPHGRCFKIFDRKRFTKEVLPQ